MLQAKANGLVSDIAAMRQLISTSIETVSFEPQQAEEWEEAYKKYLALSTLFNILSAVLNIFSFSLIVPILSILFQMEKATYTFMPLSLIHILNTLATTLR